MKKRRRKKGIHNKESLASALEHNERDYSIDDSEPLQGIVWYFQSFPKETDEGIPVEWAFYPAYHLLRTYGYKND